MIKWHGGDNPVPDKMVNYKCRDGSIIASTLSNNLYWEHTKGSFDIVEYEVVDETPSQKTAKWFKEAYKAIYKVGGAPHLLIDKFDDELLTILINNRIYLCSGS